MTVFIPLKHLQQDAMAKVQRMVQGNYGKTDEKTLLEKITDYCHQFQIMAVASLLSDDKPRMFFLNLVRSAANWIDWMQYCENHNLPAPKVSNHQFGLGALVSEEMDISQKLYEYSLNTPIAPGEPVGAYYYTRILYGLSTCETRDSARLLKDFQEMEKCGKIDPDKVKIIALFLNQKEIPFFKAFGPILQRYDDWVDKVWANFTSSVTQTAVLRHVWLEGIVLLKLAMKFLLIPMNATAYTPERSFGKLTEPYEGDWLFPL